MSLKTVPYSTIKARVEARAGEITEDDKDYFDSLLNESIQYIYDESPYWPRYLRYEPRTVSRGYIEDEEDSFHVYGAGSGAVNGLYVLDEGSGFYVKLDEDGNALFDIRPGTGAEWQIVSVSYVTSDGEFVTSDGNYVYVPGEILYENDTVSVTPPENGWVLANGENPTPIVQELAPIEQIIEQDPADRWNNPVRKQKSYREQNGNRSTDLTDGVAWVAFKRQLNDVFGDGTNGTVTEIPREFSRYVALDVSYSLQEQARRSNPNGTYTASYSQVSDAMSIALINVNRENAMNALKSQGSTYFNQDTSTR